MKQTRVSINPWLTLLGDSDVVLIFVVCQFLWLRALDYMFVYFQMHLCVCLFFRDNASLFLLRLVLMEEILHHLVGSCFCFSHLCTVVV